MFTQSTKTINLMAAVISWPSQLSMSLISVISDTGHQYVDSIKHYLDSEQSVIFANELQRRVVNLYGILNSFTKSIPIATPHQPFRPPKSKERKWNSYRNFTSILDAIESINAWKWWMALKCHMVCPWY